MKSNDTVYYLNVKDISVDSNNENNIFNFIISNKKKKIKINSDDKNLVNKNRKIKNYNKDSTRQNKGDTPIFSTIKESFRNFDQFEEEFECLTYKLEEKTKFEKLYEQDRREYSSKQSNNKPRDQLLFNDMKNKLENNIIIDKEDNLKIYKDNLINNKNLINYNNSCGNTTKNNKSVKIRNNNCIVNDKNKIKTTNCQFKNIKNRM